MGCNNSVGQNSLEIEPFKVGWLGLTFPFSLHSFIPPSNFKSQSCFDLQKWYTPFWKPQKQYILPLSIIRSQKNIIKPEIGKNKIRKF